MPLNLSLTSYTAGVRQSVFYKLHGEFQRIGLSYHFHNFGPTLANMWAQLVTCLHTIGYNLVYIWSTSKISPDFYVRLVPISKTFGLI